MPASETTRSGSRNTSTATTSTNDRSSLIIPIITLNDVSHDSAASSTEPQPGPSYASRLVDYPSMSPLLPTTIHGRTLSRQNAVDRSPDSSEDNISPPYNPRNL